MHRKKTIFLAFLICVGEGGCDLEWSKPDPSVPPPERFVEAKPRSAPPVPSGADFAALFGSEEMKQLVAGALQDNLDIAAAVARITEADAQARVSSAALWPNVSFAGSAQRSQTPPGTVSVNTAGGSAATSAVASSASGSTRSNLYQLGLNASYEIDFWGKNEDASKAARLLANASRFDRDTVQISTVASVVNAYLQVLADQDRLRIANQNVVLASKVYDAIKARFNLGTATVLDSAQQETVLEQQRATIPPTRAGSGANEKHIGRNSGPGAGKHQHKGRRFDGASFPAPSAGLAFRGAVTPARCRRGGGQAGLAGVLGLAGARRLFPVVHPDGPVRRGKRRVQEFLSPQAIAWQLAANAAQPLFDGYQLQGQYELQKGSYSELSALYHKQILTALSDVENALIAVRETERGLRSETLATDSARRAYLAAAARLAEGTIDIVTLATVETAYFQNQDLLVQARFAYLQAAVSLYQAVGGGWSPTTREVEIARANESYEANKGPWP